MTRQVLAKVSLPKVVLRAQVRTNGKPFVNMSKIRARGLAQLARKCAPIVTSKSSLMPVASTLVRELERKPVAKILVAEMKKKVGTHQSDSATAVGLWLS